MSPHPRRCPLCQVKPVAHPKAVYCFDCRPYHRRPPPPCRRCGSLEDYYTSGLCTRCHKYAPALPSSCPHCLSWGLFKHSGRICGACKDWRTRNPQLGRCGSCRDDSALNPDGVCRLCYRRARALARAEAGDKHDTRRAEAAIGGHQLFMADLEHALALKMPGRRHRRHAGTGRRPAAAPIRPATHRQGLLFDTPRDSAASPGPTSRCLRCRSWPRRWRPPPSAAKPTAGPATSPPQYAVRCGCCWRFKTPQARAIKASDATGLQAFNLQATPVLEVLASVGMLDDERPAAIVTWFAQQIHELPAQMAAELRVWFVVMREGSTIPPRMRARTDRTTRNHLTYPAGATDVRRTLRRPARGHPR